MFSIIYFYFSVGFVSHFDDVAFLLAKAGRFGPKIEIESSRIEKLLLPKCMTRKNKHGRYLWTVSITGIILIGLIISVFVCQSMRSKWTTKTVRVQFKEKTGLQDYNGCYKIDNVGAVYEGGRHAYRSDNHDNDDSSIPTFGYCQEKRQWILFLDNNTSSILPCTDTGGIIRSTKTDTYDISTSFDDSWYSLSGTPMDLYFFENEDELDTTTCGLSLNDGKCDLSFNKIEYQYDGGDCCASTCTHPSCGIGGLTSVFGNESNSGDGFSDCQDPSMVPITIHFDNIFGSHTTDIANWLDSVSDNDFFDKFVLEDIIAGSYFTDDSYNAYFQQHLMKEPANPLLILDCNGKNVISIYVDESMENATETVMVENGANCTMTVQNTTGDIDWIGDKTSILHINYTIFHGNKTSIEQKPIIIFPGETQKQNTINFKVVPTCYFEKLVYHLDNTTMYTGTTPANNAIDWLMNDKSGNSQCENPFFIERYALAVLSFSAPAVSITSSDNNRFLQVKITDSNNTTVPIFETTDPPTFLPIENYSDDNNNTMEDYSDDNNDNNGTATTTTEPSFEPTTLGGEPSDKNSWRSSARQCVWPQIICKAGFVVSLQLSNAEGSIATEIGLLPNLTNILLGTSNYVSFF